MENTFRDLHRDLSDFSGLGATRPTRIRSRAPAPIGTIDSATRPKRATRDSATRPKIAKNERLGGSAAQPTDAASGWRSHAAVPQHSGPFPGGGRSFRARSGHQMAGDHPPCRSSRSAAHPMGSSLLGKALACAPLPGCPFAESFRCIRVVASAVFTAGTSLFGSAHYRAGPLVHVRI